MKRPVDICDRSPDVTTGPEARPRAAIPAGMDTQVFPNDIKCLSNTNTSEPAILLTDY